jgi:hypothetical protein
LILFVIGQDEQAAEFARQTSSSQSAISIDDQKDIREPVRD